MISVLLDALTETLKSVDISVLLAFTAVAFVTAHGLQGSFIRDVAEHVGRAVPDRAATSATDTERTGRRPLETDVPLLGFKAELTTAAFAAISGYWVLCFRAGLRVRRARRIARRLATLDDDVTDAALLFPSLATSSRLTKGLSCIALAAFGYAAFLSIDWPVGNVIGRDIAETMWRPLIMLIPAGYLGWELRAPLDRGDDHRDAA